MYRQDIDALKGIAIIAVVLFHLGFLKSGYLGVDLFFVINGFFVIPSVIRQIGNNTFSYISFLEKKLIRFLPLVVLASAVSLGLGYFLMLPDHYENLAQAVIAGNLMSENVLSAITTKNYWDVSNEFKPLMHLWYLGILYEFYIVFPLIMYLVKFVAKKTNNDSNKVMKITLLSLCIVSFVLYIMPFDSVGNKFYFLHYRMFEIGVGGIIAQIVQSKNPKATFCKIVQPISLLFLLLLMSCSLFPSTQLSNIPVIGSANLLNNGLPISSSFALILTVLFSCAAIICDKGGSFVLRSKVLMWVGKMSFSLFIWHQVIIAFYRYSISYNMNLMAYVTLFVLSFILAIFSYYCIEKKIKATHQTFIVWVLMVIFVIIPSTYLFLHAGVVRDVPELNVVKGTEHRGMFGEYCDRVYCYNQDFPDNGKKNVLVVNISFGRDFANVLLESPYKDSINLSYVYLWRYPEALKRAKSADYIFSFTSKEDIPQEVWNIKKKTAKVYGIGTKNYGASNGVCYARRRDADFHKKTNKLVPGYKELNEKWRISWGENYIDFITPAMCQNGEIRIFTPDNRFIAQDCKHFTEAGAKWYASIINWEDIFK
ncbi:acyltransferase [Bacteroides xylanisolvens]|uniref:acyltransferase family protein n=1 Tax=Bacteroides xylanisolvens TaxID=371601 RepID=UPI0032BFFD41